MPETDRPASQIAAEPALETALEGEALQTDVVVIGAGPVGLFTVFQCGMLGMRCHVVDALSAPGGQCTALYPEKPIYDVPAHPAIAGQDLVDQLMAQATPFSPSFHLGQSVTALSGSADQGFTLSTSADQVIQARAVIIAAGAGAFGPNRPPLEGIEAFEATEAVQYFVPRREAYRGKHLVIAGGGDSAVDWALSLKDLAASVRVVHRLAKFRAAPDSVARLHAAAEAGEIDLVVPYQLAGLRGHDGFLEAVEVADLEGGTRMLAADHLLAFFGLATNLGPIREWGLDLARNQLAVNPTTAETNRPGIFAVGDVATYPHKLKLILSGFSEAAFAAHAAYSYVFPGKALHFEHSTDKGVPGAKS